MKKAIATLFVTILITLIVISPNTCINGAQRALLICGNVIIPSLFPFAVCVVFIMKTNILSKLRIIKPISKTIFNQTQEMFCTMLLSMLGGYPIGAKLINQLYNDDKITAKTAHIMQCYCINAGPAFILVAVGSGILKSKLCGILLLAAHLLASIIIAIVCSRFIKDNPTPKSTEYHNASIVDLFTESVAQAASSTMSICAFVILFSVINSYLLSTAGIAPFLNYISYLFEVTTSVTRSKNIYFISFILGFSGIAVWFQVLACSKECGVNIPIFIIFRIIHGILSMLILWIFLKIFKITLTTISNNINFELKYTFSGVSLAFSLSIMLILFLISVNSKNHCGKRIKDVL